MAVDLTFAGRPVIAGAAAGIALVSSEPLSFWGGYDYHTGEIIDRRHPLTGQIAAGRILCLPFSRGSSTTTAVLLESVKAGHRPRRDPHHRRRRFLCIGLDRGRRTLRQTSASRGAGAG